MPTNSHNSTSEIILKVRAPGPDPVTGADEAAAVEKLRSAYPILYKRLREAMSAQP